MNELNIPIPIETLQKFVAGELPVEDEERILAILAEDEETLAIVDELWTQEQHLSESIPNRRDIESERAQRIEKHIIKSIHRSNLALNVATFGTKGFLTVAMSLLKPLVDTRNANNKRSKS